MGSNPQIPTNFIANVGNAVPIANTLEILGTAVAAHAVPLQTVGSGNTISINVQYASAAASSIAANAGVASFNSTFFSVDANGFVSISGTAIGQTITGQSGGALSPTAGNWNIFGARVAAGTTPVATSGSGSTLTTNVQTSQAIASTNANNVGLAAFDSGAFDVDANGFVQLNGGGIAATAFDVQANTEPGTDPVVPSAAGVVIVNGAAVANHSVVLETRSRAVNTYNLEVQYAAAAAATDATKSGVAHFNSSFFTVDANGFVSASGTGLGQTITGQSGGALSPTAGNWNIFGGTVSAGTTPVSTSGSGSTLTTNVQISQAISAADATKIGLSNFDSTSFAVSATGFVTLIGGGFTWADVSGAFSPLKENGYFVTATATGTLPASPAQGDTIKFFVDSASQFLTIKASGTQLIRFGSLASSAGGTAISTLQGDSVELIYRASDTQWCAIAGFTGTWLMA